jgi:hypothetical protein
VVYALSTISSAEPIRRRQCAQRETYYKLMLVSHLRHPQVATQDIRDRAKTSPARLT